MQKCVTSSPYISILQTRRWCCAWTRRSRFKHLTGSAVVIDAPWPSQLCTPDYVRHGTITLLAALDAKASLVIGQFHRCHRTIEFCSFLETIDASVAAESELHCFSIITGPTRPGHQALAAASPALRVPSTLHSYRQLLAQPGRALVRATHRKTTAPWRPSQRPRTPRVYPRLP